MDYEDILNYIESIVEEIEFEGISEEEIKYKLQELIIEIESRRGMGGSELEDFDLN